MTFAALETTLNAAVAGLMANATATWGGLSVAVVFRAEDAVVGAGQVVLGRNRVYQVEAPASDFGATPPERGDELSIDGVGYVVGQVDLDPTGWLILYVSRA